MALWTPLNLAVPPRVWIDGDLAVFSGSNFTSLANTNGSEGGSFTKVGTPTKATLNSLNGINFGTAGQSLTKTVAAWGTSGVQATFNVVKMAAISGDQGIMHRGTNIAGSATTSGLTLNCGIELYMASQGFNAGQGPILHHSTASGLSASTPNILATLLGTGQNAWVDGTSLSPFDGDTEAGSFPNLGSGTYTWGEEWTGAVLNGALYQHLLLDYALTTTDRQKLEGWAAWKYGFQAQLPGGHPYASFAPLQTITGTAAPALVLTSTAAGTFTGTTTGTAAITLRPVSTATGTLGATGTASITRGPTSTAAGTLGVTGTAAITRGLASTASGTFTAAGATGTAAVGLILTPAGIGKHGVSGTAARTLPLVASGAGTFAQAITGTASINLTMTIAASGRFAGGWIPTPPRSETWTAQPANPETWAPASSNPETWH